MGRAAQARRYRLWHGLRSWLATFFVDGIFFADGIFHGGSFAEDDEMGAHGGAPVYDCLNVLRSRQLHAALPFALSRPLRPFAEVRSNETQPVVDTGIRRLVVDRRGRSNNTASAAFSDQASAAVMILPGCRPRRGATAVPKAWLRRCVGSASRWRSFGMRGAVTPVAHRSRARPAAWRACRSKGYRRRCPTVSPFWAPLSGERAIVDDTHIGNRYLRSPALLRL